MTADGLTKSLTIQKHNDFIKVINMVDVKHLIKSEDEEPAENESQ
jgi:hypothetical protein